jgi:hypothetical protein
MRPEVKEELRDTLLRTVERVAQNQEDLLRLLVRISSEHDSEDDTVAWEEMAAATAQIKIHLYRMCQLLEKRTS